MKEGGIKDAAPFKDAVLQYCGDRNDEWGREVAIRCHGVYDLAAAEAQYHLRCYNEFRKMLYNTDDVALYYDDEDLMRCMPIKNNVLGHPWSCMINIWVTVVSW